MKRGNLAIGVAAAGVVLAAVAGRTMGAPAPVKAAVLRSQGTQFLGMTIWRELNAGWSGFGDVPMSIDYTSLAGYYWTLQDIEATDADVLILSAAGYNKYSDGEIEAIIAYVEAGHGLILSYEAFRWNRTALAPLVGLSSEITLWTGTAQDPITIDFVGAAHPIMSRLDTSYGSGVRTFADPPYDDPWPLTTGVAVATLSTLQIAPRPGIITNETDSYRSVYLSYYVEDRADGANQQDMQVFYNALVWSANVPEPSAMAILTAGAGLAVLRKRRRRSERGPKCVRPHA